MKTKAIQRAKALRLNNIDRLYERLWVKMIGEECAESIIQELDRLEIEVRGLRNLYDESRYGLERS